MTIIELQVLAVPLDLAELIGLCWTTECLSPEYAPLASWGELDLLLMEVGQDEFPYLVVVDGARRRFAQCMGDTEAMIIEVCDTIGQYHPTVWRLRRPSSSKPQHADLDALMFDGDGIVAGDHIFTAPEAAIVFREWLTRGTASGLEMDEVPYS